MLISESQAKIILQGLHASQSVPIITVEQIQEISTRFMEPLLDLMEMILQDSKNFTELFKHLLELLSATYPHEGRSLESGLGEEACPDEFLKKHVLEILKKYISEESELLNSLFKEIYPVMYKLLHEYRFNKSSDRPDIDDINSLMLATGQPMVVKFGSLAQKISKNRNITPPDREIECVVEYCFILKKEQIEFKNSASDVQAALVRASQLGLVEVIDFLIKTKQANPNGLVNGMSPLGVACSSGDMSVVQKLFEYKVDVNVEFISGDDKITALHAASLYGHVKIAEVLFKKGSRLTELTSFGDSVLSLACRQGHIAFVEFLLNQEGIDRIINQPNSDGHTPLMIAAKRGFSGIAEMLMIALNQWGISAYKAKDYKQAIECFEAALSKTPEKSGPRASLLYNIGSAKMQSNNLRGALEDLADAISICEENNMATEAKKYKKRLEACQQVVKPII